MKSQMLPDRESLNLSFAGCGFLGIYHVGVAAAFRKYAPDLTFNRVSGASAGAMAAVCLIAGTPLSEMANDLISATVLCRSHLGGPFNPNFNVCKVIEERLINILPENVHELVNGKLHISVTRVYDGQNVIINNFVSKKEVVDAVIASTFIPVFSGFIPYRYRGVRVIDGGFSDNIPKLDDSTITVSPFSGDSVICPEDTQANKTLHRLYFAEVGHNISIKNIGRLINVLFPPPASVLAELCSEGFKDAVAYLQKIDKINCTRCLFISSVYSKHDHMLADEDRITQEHHDMEHSMGEQDNCIHCQKELEKAVKGVLPENVSNVFEDIIARADNNLKQRSYLYKYLWPIITHSPPFIISKYCINLSLGAGSVFFRFVQNRIPILRDDEKFFEFLEGGIVSILKKVSQIHEVQVRKEDDEIQLPSISSSGVTTPAEKAYFSCDVHLTQYGHDAADTTDYSETEDEYDNELLNVAISTVIPNGERLSKNSDAIRFQKDNLWTAVHSHSSKVNSRRSSIAVAELLTNINSRHNSRAPSRQMSRRDSVSSVLTDPDEIAAQDSLNQIVNISEKEEAMFQLHYQNDGGDLCTMAMYNLPISDSANMQPQNYLDPKDVGLRLRQEQQRQSVAQNPSEYDEEDYGSCISDKDEDRTPTLCSSPASEDYDALNDVTMTGQ